MKKIKLKVKNDYSSNFSWELYEESLYSLLYGLDVRVENKNNKMCNILSKLNSYKKYNEYKYFLSVDCVGYCQSEWDEYSIYFDYEKNSVEERGRIEQALKELKLLFTHKNDYIVDKIEVLDSGHKKTLDTFSFSIIDVEFPEENEIKNYIDEQLIYYDDIEFNLN